MIYGIFADLVLLAHSAFILFVIFGGMFSLHNRKWAWLHIPVFLWGSLVNLMGWVCPLTPWEIHLRQMADQSIYTGGFVEHYIGKLVYPPGLGPNAGLILGLGVLAWNILIYGLVFYRMRQRHIDHSPG